VGLQSPSVTHSYIQLCPQKMAEKGDTSTKYNSSDFYFEDVTEVWPMVQIGLIVVGMNCYIWVCFYFYLFILLDKY
jgi:hypothetical protein